MVKLFSAKTNPSKKEITLRDNTVITVGEVKNLSMQSNWLKSKKQNIPMVYWSVNSETCLKKQLQLPELRVKYCFNYVSHVWIMLCTVWGLLQAVGAGRQLVSHRHITVNGEKVNIPSYQVKAGDVVAVREKSKSLEAIQNSLANANHVYEWITWNGETKEGTFVSVPQRLQIPENINEQFIVELYSK